MNRATMGAATLVVVFCAACAADKREAKAPDSASAYPSQNGQPAGDAAQPYPQPSMPKTEIAPAPPQPGQPGQFAPPPMAPAMRSATEDLERGKRELESAGGQCKNACRALSSMDRAAGKICGLEPGDRCDDAKQKLYSARDRVRSSCGTCEDGTSVDRNAPVPSR